MDKFVAELRALREKVSRDEAALKEMCRPVIGISYAGWVKQRIKDNDIYLFVALRLFSPRTLAGKRMECGNVRDEICKHMGLNKWSVSKRVQLVLFYYENVKNFRHKVGLEYKMIIEELGLSGILPDWERYL